MQLISYPYNLCTDTRREARKAFLALSSNDAKAQVDGSVPDKSDHDNAIEQRADEDVQFSQSTPVSSLPCQSYK